MILKEIHIDGFGIFNSFSLTTIGKGVNILLGNNEVGKSTLLKFLRYTLFGYPRLLDQRMPPLNGGNHGGRIKTILSSGKEVLFQRTGDDSIRLLYDGRESQNQSQWSQLLGNASGELYNKVYAFSLDELVGLGSLTTSGVEDKIFSLGLGLGNTSIGEVENNIQGRVDNIYKPRGKVQLLPEILKKIEIEKSTLQQIQENLPKYQGLFQEMKRLTQAITELDKTLKELWGEKNKLNNYLKCYESFISITKANEELQELAEFQDYPEKGIEQLDKLEEKEEELIDKIRELQSGTQDEKGIEELEEETKKSSFNEKLLENVDKVEYLHKNLEKYKQTISDRNGDEESIKEYQQSIKQYIGDINAQWTEQNIIEFTDLNTHKNKIEEFKNEFKKLEDDKRDLEAVLKAIQAKESPLNAKNIAVIASIIFFIASIPAFYYGVYVLGASLLLVALILFLGKKYFLKESSHVQIQQQLEELKRNEQKLKGEYESSLEQQLNLPNSLSVETVLDVFKTIEQLRAKITERNKLKEKLEKERLPFIQEFENEAYTLEDILQNKKQKENIEIIVNHIVAEFDASKTKSQEKDKLQHELKRKKKELENTELKLEQTQTQIKKLSNLISAKDQQDFRKQYEENNKVKGLIKERDAANQTIEKIVGLNKVEEVIKYLTANEKETIESKISELTNEIESKAQAYKEKNNELGEKRNEIKRVEGESELAEVSTELETEKQKLQNAYKDWSSGKVALNILADVKAKYEKEKQPEVIKHSSNYFNKITGGRYKRIRVSLDDRDVAVYDSKEASKKIGQLSRGDKRTTAH